MVAVAEDVDIVSTIDLRGLDLRPLLRLCGYAEHGSQQHGADEGEKNLWHCRPPWDFIKEPKTLNFGVFAILLQGRCEMSMVRPRHEGWIRIVALRRAPDLILTNPLCCQG